MAFSTTCPSCGAGLRLSDEFAGREARCGQCGAVFVAADEDDFDRPRRRPRDEGNAGAGVTALVLGIVALLTWPCPPAGLVSGGAAIVAGGISLSSRSRGLAVVGIVFGLAGGVFSLGCGVLYGVAIRQEQHLNEPGGNRPPFFHGD